MPGTNSSQPRLDFAKVPPEALHAVYGLQRYVDNSGLDPALIYLVKVRASQMNGCAYCIDMHTKDARARGETEQRLYALVVWRETPFFTDRERAALEWTEAVTMVSRDQVPDSIYESVRRHFNEKELIDLTIAVAAINVWNRLAISFRAEVGSYQPARH